jgi:hypothetical protein
MVTRWETCRKLNSSKNEDDRDDKASMPMLWVGTSTHMAHKPCSLCSGPGLGKESSTCALSVGIRGTLFWAQYLTRSNVRLLQCCQVICTALQAAQSLLSVAGFQVFMVAVSVAWASGVLGRRDQALNTVGGIADTRCIIRLTSRIWAW